MKRMRYKRLFILLFYIILFGKMNAAGQVIELETEKSTINLETEEIETEGNVTVKYGDYTINADKLKKIANRNIISGSGNVEFTQGSQIIKADNLIFDMDTKLAKIFNSESYDANVKLRYGGEETLAEGNKLIFIKDDKKVYFSKEYADIQELQNVDVKSFEALHFENIENKDDFGKDKNKVYLFGLELKDVKPEKFQVVKEPITEKIIYVRDENNLFVIFYDYFSGFNFVEPKKIENIDFKTLKWKSARELEDKNGKYIVNGSVIDEDKIEIKFIKK
mgnify:CR=1 FL=1